jgi:hypothetical protein
MYAGTLGNFQVDVDLNRRSGLDLQHSSIERAILQLQKERDIWKERVYEERARSSRMYIEGVNNYVSLDSPTAITGDIATKKKNLKQIISYFYKTRAR